MSDEGKDKSNMPEQSFDAASFSMYLEKHDHALEALKDVPKLLEELSKAAGIAKAPRKDHASSDWSLGLSDPEDDPDTDINKIINEDDNPADAEIEDILRDIEKCTDFGPELVPNVADSFTKTVIRPLTKDTRSTLKEKMKIPANCKQFVAPKVNPEIWRLLPSHGKLADVKNQQIQQVVSAGLSQLSMIANTVATNKDKIPKDVMSSILRNTIDGANILGDQFQTISVKRRYEIKKYLNPEYGGICSAQIAPSEWLFGTDLNENLKSSKATATLIKATGTNRNNYRFRPYQPSSSFVPRGNSLNGNRPFQSFQQQRNGQPRFRQTTSYRPSRFPNSAYNQQRFQKYQQ